MSADEDHDEPHPAGRIEVIGRPAIGARVRALVGTAAVLGVGIISDTGTVTTFTTISERGSGLFL